MKIFSGLDVSDYLRNLALEDFRHSIEAGISRERAKRQTGRCLDKIKNVDKEIIRLIKSRIAVEAQIGD